MRRTDPAVGPPPASYTLAGAVLADAEGERRAELHILDGRIAAAAAPGAAVIDLSGCAILPGLVNAHDHLSINSVPCPAVLPPQPNAYLWAEAFQPYFAHPDFRAAKAVDEGVRAWHGGLKNLIAGTTTVAHHDPWHAAMDAPDFPVHVLSRFGWSHSLGLGDSYGPPVKTSYDETPKDAPWCIHLAEGTDDVAAAELSRLAAHGALGQNTVVVHGVGLAPADVRRLLDSGAGVVWCPSSNLRMLGATLFPRLLFDAGRLALGTDSRFSGSRDLLEEIRIARDSSDLSPGEILRLVTRDAARLLRLDDVGSLAPGSRADLVLLARADDPAEQLLQSHRADLLGVVHSGRLLIGDPALEPLFEAAAVGTVCADLDGRSKLLARSLLARDALALEPGLSLS